MQAMQAPRATRARVHPQLLFQFKPDGEIRGGTATYGQLLKRMWAHVRGPELVDCDGNLGELPAGATVLVQLGFDDFHAYQFLARTRRQRPDLKRVIVAHDPPRFPRSKLALAESISRHRAERPERGLGSWVRSDSLDRAALSPSDRWVTMSKVGCAALTERLRRLGISAPTVGLIPHGLHSPTPRIRQRSARAPLSVGLFGHVTRSRELDTLVDAAGFIAEQHGLWMVPRFIVAGAPDSASSRRELADRQARLREEKLDSRFEFLGRVPNEQIPAFFQSIDVLALPYGNRGAYSSGPLHFAWTYGIPVLANPSPCLEELLSEHPAQLLASPSAEAWVEKLLLLQWDHQFWAGARRAILHAQLQNSWRQVVAAFKALMEGPVSSISIRGECS